MITDWLSNSFYGNTVLAYATALLIFLVSSSILKIVKTVVLHRLKRWAKKTETTLDDLIISLLDRCFLPPLYFGILYFSLRTLVLSPALLRLLNIAGVLIITFFGVRAITQFLDYLLRRTFVEKGDEEEMESREKRLQGIMPALRVLVWGLGLVFLLDNLGFKISTVIAGLGIGGIAVALAAQAVLGDLFSYISVLLDRPFEVGDFIIVEDQMGVVEKVGIKTTRLRSLGGEQLIFSNSYLTSSRIRNFKRMERRRVLFRIGVTYQTPLERLKEIPETIRSIIESVENATFDRCHFFAFGDSSLDIETVYYVESNDYALFMDVQQAINLAAMEALEEKGVEFAYPTQTLFLNKE